MAVALSLTVLGCDGSYPGPGGACSGYLVQDGATTVWLDAGSGTLANLQRHIGLEDVDAVVLSHEHPDHWTDLEGYNVVCHYMLERQGVPVYAPAGLKQRTYEDTAPYLVWNTIADGERIEIGALSFTFSRTDHGPETLASRIEGGGRVLGYSADTGPGWSLEALGPGLDVALCEASFQREQEGIAQHLSARQAGETAASAGVGRLVLTHRWPTLDPERTRTEGAESFGRDVELATIDARYEI